MGEPLPAWVGAIIALISLAILVAIFAFAFSQARRTASPGHSSLERSLKQFNDCLSAYERHDYQRVAKLGASFLESHFSATMGIATIIALRRLKRFEDAEELGRRLLMTSFGPNGTFLYLMRVLDNDLSAHRLLDQCSASSDLPNPDDNFRCQVYFCEGARLLTEGKIKEAEDDLVRATGIDCDALERRLAIADLQSIKGR